MDLIRLARNIVMDLRFGGRLLGGDQASRFSHLGASCTRNTDYRVLAEIFRQVEIRPDDVIVDVGCGKGRVLNFLLWQGLANQIVGLELDPLIAARAGRRLARYPNVRVIQGDAREVLPQEASIVYMFNPFKREIMQGFCQRLKSLPRVGRATVIYYNPRYLDLFADDPFWSVRTMQPRHLDNQAAFITAREP